MYSLVNLAGCKHDSLKKIPLSVIRSSLVVACNVVEALILLIPKSYPVSFTSQQFDNEAANAFQVDASMRLVGFVSKRRHVKKFV